MSATAPDPRSEVVRWLPVLMQLANLAEYLHIDDKIAAGRWLQLEFVVAIAPLVTSRQASPSPNPVSSFFWRYFGGE